VGGRHRGEKKLTVIRDERNFVESPFPGRPTLDCEPSEWYQLPTVGRSEVEMYLTEDDSGRGEDNGRSGEAPERVRKLELLNFAALSNPGAAKSPRGDADAPPSDLRGEASG
jgi:hypothetical protein